MYRSYREPITPVTTDRFNTICLVFDELNTVCLTYKILFCILRQFSCSCVNNKNLKTNDYFSKQRVVYIAFRCP